MADTFQIHPATEQIWIGTEVNAYAGTSAVGHEFTNKHEVLFSEASVVDWVRRHPNGIVHQIDVNEVFEVSLFIPEPKPQIIRKAHA